MHEKKASGIMSIRSLAVRFIVLLLIALPVFTPALNVIDLSPYFPVGVPKPVLQLLPYTVYATVLFIVVVFTIGALGLARLLAVGIPLALVVSITRALLPRIPVLGDYLQGSKIDTNIEEAALQQLVTMITVVPLALFIVQCFPPAEIITRMRGDSKHISENAIRLAIVLRIYTVVSDAIASFWKAWIEENPSLLLPRHRSEATSTQKIYKFPFWFLGAAKTWALALITYTIEQIPSLIHQLDITLSSAGDSNGK